MSDYQKAIDYVLRNEGGYVNDPDDPGGETKYGICKRDHPDVDIRNLTPDQADVIYRRQYWLYDNIASQLVATKLLDWAVNLEGTGQRGEAIMLLQLAASEQFPGEEDLDGIYGPKTEALANKCNPDLLVRAMIRYVLTYRAGQIEKNPKLEKFGPGWARRDVQLPTCTMAASI